MYATLGMKTNGYSSFIKIYRDINETTYYIHACRIKEKKTAKCELDSLTKGSVPNARLKVNENLRSRLKNSKFQFAGECTYCV